MERLVEIFKIMSDPTRLKIIKLLMQREMYVCEIVEVLRISQPGISQQLRRLKTAKIAKERRDGMLIYYSLIPGVIEEFEKTCRAFFRSPLEQIQGMEKEYQKFITLNREEIINCCNGQE